MAAPASFLSAADLVQAALASFSHLVMKDVMAAPANFFSMACALQVGVAVGAETTGGEGAVAGAVCAYTAVVVRAKAAKIARAFMIGYLWLNVEGILNENPPARGRAL